MMRRIPRQLPRTAQIQRRHKSVKAVEHDIDDLGMPVQPTWSVNDLLSRSPAPTISAETLSHLHKLAALVPPKPDSLEHERLTEELEDMVKLVEAVKHVDVESVREDGVVPDGRLWQAGRGMSVLAKSAEHESEDTDEGDSGAALLSHAQRAVGGYYVVEHRRNR